MSLIMPSTVRTAAGVVPSTFYVLANAVTPGLNKSMLSITVDSPSTRKVTLKDLFIVNLQTAAITGVNTEFNLLRITSHSVGTSLTPQAYDTADALSSTITVRTGATVAGRAAAALRQWYLCGDESVPGAATNQGVQLLSQFAPPLGLPTYKQPTLRAGQGFSIECITNVAVGSWGIGLVFTDEDA